ncbi:DUF397 domain-containing protein [Actinomadura atramentaria]|uniref:DUF397 domain-containing protein n=1 Tax=Actinomadura atramentaria TaxID=1990 RepID=UPI000477BED7|nr:DUF397 domain-containing protein [Actinomadura atramentaria]
MTTWRKSSRSANSGQTNCVEVGRLPRTIGLRDSKNPGKGHLAVNRSAFAGLLADVKSGALDL